MYKIPPKKFNAAKRVDVFKDKSWLKAKIEAGKT